MTREEYAEREQKEKRQLFITMIAECAARLSVQGRVLTPEECREIVYGAGRNSETLSEFIRQRDKGAFI